MAQSSFILALVLGAAVLGLWVDLRVGERRPASPTRRFVHAGIAFAVLQLTSNSIGHFATAGSPAERRLTVLFLVFVPSLVYAFLAALWLMRTLAEAART